MPAFLSRAKPPHRAESARSGTGGADAVNDPQKLRELASWYRAFAERTGNPTIWDARLRTAENLEAEAARLERRSPSLAEGVAR
jgi:hypothetical protein